jgi:hypothetical protein
MKKRVVVLTLKCGGVQLSIIAVRLSKTNSGLLATVSIQKLLINNLDLTFGRKYQETIEFTKNI